MGIKVSNTMDKALAHLRTFAASQLADLQPQNRIELNIEQRDLLLSDYSTKLVDGTERGVTAGDLEAVDNFHRDMHTATKLITSEAGVPYMEANEEADSVKMTFALPEVGGHGLTITQAVYRPGAEETHSQDYSAVTRNWTSSEDDKAIDDHLKKLTSRLKSKKK